MEIITIPVLTAVVYLALWLYKYMANGKEKLVRLIPVLAALLGAALGVTAFYIAGNLMPASDVFTALLIGAASGLAATGTHQIFKQLGANGEPESTAQNPAQTQPDNQSKDETNADKKGS